MSKGGPNTKKARTLRAFAEKREDALSSDGAALTLRGPLGLDRLLRRAAVDRDLAGLLGFRDLADEIDVQEPVLQRRAGNLDAIGKLEAALERPGGDTLIEHFALTLRLRGLLLASDRQSVFLHLDAEILVSE